jgi:hypothetical protein
MEVNVGVLNKLTAGAGALVMSLALLALPAAAAGKPDHAGEGGAKGAPPGNNGTVKIDGVPFDTAPGAPNRNEPHVPCDFRVEFYNYEEGSTWNVTFEAWRPPGDRAASQVVVASGRANDGAFHGMDLNDDPASGANAEGIDHREEYRLAFPDLEPHPQQGFHVKATAVVDDPDPRGAEKKHKVFWVAPCEEASPTSSTQVGGAGEEDEEQGESGEQTSTTSKKANRATQQENQQVDTDTPAEVSTEVLFRTVERPARAAAPASPQVLGVAIERPQPPAAQQLARTGSGSPALVPLALALIAVGLSVTLAASDRRARANLRQ